MRSSRFSRRSSQKIVVNGVRVDTAYLKAQAEKKAADKEALRKKRVAVRRRKPKPAPIVERVPEVVVKEAVVKEDE